MLTPCLRPGSAVAFTAIASALILSACTSPAEPAVAPPKPVKTEIVGSNAGSGSADNFVGTLRARQRSDLGFETGGRVVAISGEVGDRVRAGQVLARLDEAPARWRLEKAEADRSAAEAALSERRTQLQQQEALARDKIISPTALETTRTAHQQARSQLDAAEAALATAKRDLALTRITAPFDGEIVARLAQPFSDTAAGQAILQIQSGRALEVVAMLPDTVAATLSPGFKAQGRIGAERFPLELERLSARSDNGSLVHALFRVPQAPASARSGGVVSVELPGRQPAASISLSATAVMPSTQAGQATVFILEPAGTLQRRAVRTSATLLPEGRVAITEGLAAGDRVVVAGTAFLHEGQRATAYASQTLLHGQPKEVTQ